jgi:hypothetical protein
VNAPNWKGQVRIVPGEPDNSLLYFLISHRGSGMQMPPIATRIVDQANVAVVRRWISLMPPLPHLDAGVPDVGEDGGVDAGEDVAPDVAAPDAEVDAGAPDAAEDAGVDAEPDAGTDGPDPADASLSD